MDRIRVLGIAPYEGLKKIMTRVAEEYPQIELTTFIGDLEQGLEIAKRHFHNNYDAVISRGMTAELLKQLSIPVIGIEMTIVDILSVLRLADPNGKSIAVVCYFDITNITKQLCDALGYKIDVYPLQSSSDATEVLRICQERRYEVILCDAVVNQTARKLGLNTFLITSGPDSIRQAFNQLIATCRNQQNLRNENKMLRMLISNQISSTVLFDSAGDMVLSSIEDPPDELINMLKDEIEETIEEKERKITRIRNSIIYSIRALHVQIANERYTAFFFTAKKATIQDMKSGITFMSRREAEEDYYNSLFYLAGTINSFSQTLSRIRKNNHPILISGEEGTGKTSLAEYIYITSQYSCNKFVMIDCSLLDDKSWTFLLTHQASPLLETENAIYFKNIDALSPYRSNALLNVIIASETCESNIVFMSCGGNHGQKAINTNTVFADKLCAITLLIPSLREQQDSISNLFNQVINNLSIDMMHTISSIEPEAISMLEEYPWPHNFIQFKRVVNELMTTAAGTTITAASVKAALEKERHIGYVIPSDTSFKPIDFNRPLKDIEKEIVQRVLEANSGNQTKTAKSLGIGRTTLWRLLSQDER